MRNVRFTFTIQAGTHERFAPNAFDSRIGQSVPFKEGEENFTATVVAAKVSTDGSQVELTVQT